MCVWGFNQIPAKVMSSLYILFEALLGNMSPHSSFMEIWFEVVFKMNVFICVLLVFEVLSFWVSHKTELRISLLPFTSQNTADICIHLHSLNSHFVPLYGTKPWCGPSGNQHKYVINFKCFCLVNRIHYTIIEKTSAGNIHWYSLSLSIWWSNLNKLFSDSCCVHCLWAVEEVKVTHSLWLSLKLQLDGVA